MAVAVSSGARRPYGEGIRVSPNRFRALRVVWFALTVVIAVIAIIDGSLAAILVIMAVGLAVLVLPPLVIPLRRASAEPSPAAPRLALIAPRRPDNLTKETAHGHAPPTDDRRQLSDAVV